MNRNFCICVNTERLCEAACPVCGDKFRADYLNVHEYFGQTPGDIGNALCILCAWNKALVLANLLTLSEAAEAHNHREMPPHLQEALTQRNNDPDQLKNRLTEALHKLGAFDGHGERMSIQSPLAALVAEQIGRALESGNVSNMQHTMAIFEESNLEDTGIPF